MKIVTDDGVEIPFDSIQIVEVKPSDLVVFKIPDGFDYEEASDLHKGITRFFNNMKIDFKINLITINDRIGIEVIRKV